MPLPSVFSRKISAMQVQVIYAEPDRVLTCWLDVANNPLWRIVWC